MAGKGIRVVRKPKDETEEQDALPGVDLRNYCRDVAMQSLTEIATKLAEMAKGGSVPHLKALLQMSGLDKGGPVARPKSRTLEEILMEQWRNDPDYSGNSGNSGNKNGGKTVADEQSSKADGESEGLDGV